MINKYYFGGRKFIAFVFMIAILLIIFFAMTKPLKSQILAYDFENGSGVIDYELDKPDKYLNVISDLVSRSEYLDALDYSEKLINNFPTFHAGKLIYSDLLRVTLGADDELDLANYKNIDVKIKDLRSELSKRVESVNSRYVEGTVPGNLSLIHESIPYVAVVDASASRLYWFKNITESSGTPRLQLVFETYVTVGVNGVGKNHEGDGKSPLGVYFTKKILPKGKLPKFYGVGALTLNFPNMYDVHKNRTGSGIWIHGVSPSYYSRPPEASDGCLVMSNDDMSNILDHEGLIGVPVIVQKNVEWISWDDEKKIPAEMIQALNNRYNINIEKLTNLNQVKIYASWMDGEDKITLVDLRLNSNKLIRTYWTQQKTGWEVLAEVPI